jgi:hypothetical protein
MSMDLSMNSCPRVPAESSSHEVVHANAHVASSCRVNSKSHNPSSAQRWARSASVVSLFRDLTRPEVSDLGWPNPVALLIWVIAW